MLCLLVSQNGIIDTAIKTFCSAHDVAAVVYRLPLKALDNITELVPDIVIINSIDFPRHWKIVVQHLNGTADAALKKVLIAGEHFSPSDAKKAEFLHVDLILHADKTSTVYDLENLSTLFSLVQRKRVRLTTQLCTDKVCSGNTEAQTNTEKAHTGFSVFNPACRENVVGEIVSISSEKVHLKFRYPHACRGLKAGTRLTQTHLEAGKNVFTPDCRLETCSETDAVFTLLWQSKIEKKFFAHSL